MATPTTTRQYLLAKAPTGRVDLAQTFKLVDSEIPQLKDGKILVQAQLLSNDPAQRTWIQAGQDASRLYAPPVAEGEVMKAGGIGTVIESKSSKFPKGARVSGSVGWSQYAVLDDKDALPVKAVEGLNESHFLGAFGGPGLTAKHGLETVRVSDKDDLLVVSGAAGATGSMVVQIAKKMLGVKRVIGIAGSEDKCRWVERLGADLCLNYKSKTFADDLANAVQGKADVYWDNVGGEILDLMLGQIKRYGRVLACGAISQYNSMDDGVKLKNWPQVISMRYEIRGIIIFDAAKKLPEYRDWLLQGYKDGKIDVDVESETVVPTKFEEIPKTWSLLFEGGNTGKLVTRIEI